MSSNHSIIYAHITYCNNAGLIACKPSSLRPVLLYWWVLPRSLTIWGCWEQNNHHSTYGRVSTVSIVIGVLISSRLQYAIITSFKLIVRLAIANRQVSNFHFTKQTESRSLVWKAVAGVAALHLLPRPGDSQHIYQEDPTNDANVWWYTCSTLRFLSMVLAEDDWRVGKIREPTQIEISSKIFRGFVFLPMAITSRGSKCVSVQRVQHKNPSVLASCSKALPAQPFSFAVMASNPRLLGYQRGTRIMGAKSKTLTRDTQAKGRSFFAGDHLAELLLDHRHFDCIDKAAKLPNCVQAQAPDLRPDAIMCASAMLHWYRGHSPTLCLRSQSEPHRGQKTPLLGGSHLVNG